MKIHEMYDFTGKFSLVRGFSKIKTFKFQKSKTGQKENFQLQETFAQTL